jgi:hypothetical protein
MRKQHPIMIRLRITIILLLLVTIAIDNICYGFIRQQPPYTECIFNNIQFKKQEQQPQPQERRNIYGCIQFLDSTSKTRYISSLCLLHSFLSSDDNGDRGCSTNDNGDQINKNRRNIRYNTRIPVANDGRIGNRHQFLVRLIQLTSVAVGTTAGTAAVPVHAAETIGKDPNCNDSTCLGVWDGLLADCPHDNTIFSNRAGCVASQDDTPGIFAEPWDYSESSLSLNWQEQMKLLIPSIQIVSAKRGDTCQILIQDGRYLRVQFIDRTSNEISIGEFYFTPNDTTVQFRIGSTSTGNKLGVTTVSSSLKNIERAEMIRKEIKYLKLPVLRNRQRTLLFFENDQIDTFGPGSAALGPPSEMSLNEITGGGSNTFKSKSIISQQQGRLSDNVDPKLKIDLVQSFPTIPSTTSATTTSKQ